MKILKSSLIIPSNSTIDSLNFFFENVLTWTSLPKEIILINTNKKKIKPDKIFIDFFYKKKFLSNFFMLQNYIQVQQEI